MITAYRQCMYIDRYIASKVEYLIDSRINNYEKQERKQIIQFGRCCTNALFATRPREISGDADATSQTRMVPYGLGELA